MSDDPLDGGNRATTALVYRSVDELGKRMDVHFDGVKQRLDRLEPVEGRVDGHDRILAEHEVRILSLEEDNRTRTLWQKVQRPTMLISVVTAAVAVLALILT